MSDLDEIVRDIRLAWLRSEAFGLPSDDPTLQNLRRAYTRKTGGAALGAVRR